MGGRTPQLVPGYRVRIEHHRDRQAHARDDGLSHGLVVVNAPDTLYMYDPSKIGTEESSGPASVGLVADRVRFRCTTASEATIGDFWRKTISFCGLETRSTSTAIGHRALFFPGFVEMALHPAVAGRPE